MKDKQRPLGRPLMPGMPKQAISSRGLPRKGQDSQTDALFKYMSEHAAGLCGNCELPLMRWFAYCPYCGVPLAWKGDKGEPPEAPESGESSPDGPEGPPAAAPAP